jgi:hypothetical protein
MTAHHNKYSRTLSSGMMLEQAVLASEAMWRRDRHHGKMPSNLTNLKDRSGITQSDSCLGNDEEHSIGTK